MIDPIRLNPLEWPIPAEPSSKPLIKSQERVSNNKLKACTAWQEE